MLDLNDRSALSHADVILIGLAYASLIFTVAYQITGLGQEFSVGFAMEDGPVEWGTAVFLFLSAIVLFRNAAALRAKRGAAAALITGFYGIVFIFGAGEEISWGQRVFGWESGEFFTEHNAQNETTLHNLVVGEEQLAKTLFGSVLTLVLLAYLVVFPLLFPHAGWVRKLARALCVPVPERRHVLLALLASLVIVAVDLDRKWEVYEFIFSLLTCSIFLRPRNAEEVT